MRPETTCLNCGGLNVLPGTLCSANLLSFRSEHTRFLGLRTPDMKVGSNLCLDCGWTFPNAGMDEVQSLVEAVSIFACRAVAYDRPEHIGVVWPVQGKH